MTPTLRGRLQTRLVLASTFGLAWTLVVAGFLPRPPASSMGMASGGTVMNRLMQTLSTNAPISLGVTYETALALFALMTFVGMGWEFVYQALQSTRREGDWPPLLVLASAIPEGALLWLVGHLLGVDTGSLALTSPDFPMFCVQFTTTWIVLWLAMLGPIRILSPRWHLSGMSFSRAQHSHGDFRGGLQSRQGHDSRAPTTG